MWHNGYRGNTGGNMNLKDALKGKLTTIEFSKLKTAFDTVGSIAIIEIDEELIPKEKFIAQTLLDMHKHITTVVKKVGIHAGELRLQKVKVLAGKRTKETIHKESSCRLKLNVEKVYFSVRLGTERLRIAQLIKPDEEVLVMFSGCAPYPCVLSKNSAAKHITGVELNKEGYEYGLENVQLNKVKNVDLYQGDVRKVVPKFKKKFDRILMPLPKSAEDFLDIALNAVKKGGIIHFYDFLHIDDIPKAALAKIRKSCKIAGKTYKTVSWNKCGSHAPRTYRICVDFKVLS